MGTEIKNHTSDSLKTRVKTAAVIAVPILSMIAFSGVPEVMQVFTGALSCIAAIELFRPAGDREGAELFLALSVFAAAVLAMLKPCSI